MKHFKMGFLALAIFSVTFSACKSMNKTQKGAVIGTAAGSAAGAVIGRASGNTALGAIIGAAVGGVGGAVIGRQMDKQAEEIKKEIPDVNVSRVGEGIVVEFTNDILFAFDSYTITPAAKVNLDKLVTILNTYSETDIAILGYTDSKGTAAYNKNLSIQRADAVASDLISKKIASARITTLGYGEQNAKYTNTTASGQALNRRVEFVITANEKMIKDAKEAEKNSK